MHGSQLEARVLYKNVSIEEQHVEQQMGQLGLLVLFLLHRPIHHLRQVVSDVGQEQISVDLCTRAGFRSGLFFEVSGSLGSR